jgi:hypothetical protein
VKAYNRYAKSSGNGRTELLPFTTIDRNRTDRYETYRSGITRMDLVSFKYYGDPSWDWLIMMANPDVAGIEFDIPDGTLLRIPYPLESAVRSFENRLERYESLYGYE